MSVLTDSSNPFPGSLSTNSLVGRQGMNKERTEGWLTNQDLEGGGNCAVLTQSMNRNRKSIAIFLTRRGIFNSKDDPYQIEKVKK